MAEDLLGSSSEAASDGLSESLSEGLSSSSEGSSGRSKREREPNAPRREGEVSIADLREIPPR